MLFRSVRNYQARNFLRGMQVGDRAFFYHSNAELIGITGLAEVVATGLDDPTQFDPQSKYYDPKSSPDAPRWQTVQIKFLEIFPQIISLATLKEEFAPEELGVVKTGNRLSVMPVSLASAEKINNLALK